VEGRLSSQERRAKRATLARVSDEHHGTGTGIALGMSVGIAIGAATDNVGAWLAIGLALGAAFEGRGPRSGGSDR
ncbi:MAG: hypothetical protein OXG35_18820, partial [Acidobacteria bacterium]|nr:hypothetical protein [Acidobacteriota bacterium]